MNLTRRQSLGLFAAASVPVHRALASAAVQETQEERCIRLTRELLTEYSKLSMTGRSMGGPYVDLGDGTEFYSLRYTRRRDGAASFVALPVAREAKP